MTDCDTLTKKKEGPLANFLVHSEFCMTSVNFYNYFIFVAIGRGFVAIGS